MQHQRNDPTGHRPALTVIKGGVDPDEPRAREAEALRASETLLDLLPDGDDLQRPLSMFVRLLRVRALQAGLEAC